MKRLALLSFAALLLAGCEEDVSRTVSPDVDVRAQRGGRGPSPEAAVEARINGLIKDLFPRPERREANQLFAEIKSSLARGDTAAATAGATDLLKLALTTDLNDPPGPDTARDGLEQLADALFSFVGLSVPTVADDDDGVIALAPANTDTTILTEEKFAGVTIEAGDNGEDLVVVIERLTEDEQADLPGGECLPTTLDQREGCYQFERFPEGSFQDTVVVGVCHVGISDEFQLHRFSDPAEGVVPLPNVTFGGLSCGTFTVASAADAPFPWQLARAAWGATAGRLVDWLGPRPLHAVDAGFGGSTLDFSRIGWAAQMDVDVVEGDGQTAAPGTQVATDPKVRVTHLPESDDGSPIHDVDVSFTVLSGGGSVGSQGSGSITATTDASGEASVTWTLGPSAGTNELQAAVPGDTVVFTATAAPSSSLPVAGFGTATVDGDKGVGEWSNALTVSVFSNDPDLDGSELLVMNDGTDLYLGLEVPDPFTASDIWEVRFDNTNDDTQVAGDDEIQYSQSGGFRDGHYNGTYWGALDAVSHGAGAGDALAAGVAFFEMSHPLSSGDADDLDIAAGDVFGLCTRFFDEGGSASATTDVFPSNCVLVTNDQTLYLDVEVAQ